MQDESIENEQVHVFVSHKAVDRELAATFMLNLLKHDVHKKIHTFISSFDISAGKPWPTEVHNELRNSQWLILFYTSPEQNWNWCLYEAGYFSAFIEEDPKKRIFCIHHPNVEVPKPLDKWQNITANRPGIKNLAKFLYKAGETRLGLYPDLFEDPMIDERKIFFKKLNSLFSKKVATKSFIGKCWITIYKEQLKDLQMGQIPEKSLISFDELSKKVFGIGGVDETFVWEKFLEHYLNPDQSLWSSKLAGVLQKAMTKEVESTFALLCDSKRQYFYRPVFEEMHYLFNGDMSFKFSFIPIPTYFNPESEKKIDKLFHLLNVQHNIRWRVIEKHKKIIEEYLDRTKEIISPDDGKLVAELFLHDLAECTQDARNRGLRSDKDSIELFENSNKDDVIQIIENWHKIEEEIKNTVEEINMNDLLNKIIDMKKLNSQYRKIIANTYFNVL